MTAPKYHSTRTELWPEIHVLFSEENPAVRALFRFKRLPFGAEVAWLALVYPRCYPWSRNWHVSGRDAEDGHSGP